MFHMSGIICPQFSDDFFPSTSHLFFRLPSKGRSSITLGDRWHFFFFSNIACVLLCPFIDILAICSINYHCLPLRFPRDTGSRKGKICPFCVPILKKKKKKKKSQSQLPTIEVAKQSCHQLATSGHPLSFQHLSGGRPNCNRG